jgi:hypothetical protein
MLKPIVKVSRELIHHPSDVLDDLCRYDAANRRWRAFDESLSQQLLGLEFVQRRNIRVRLADRRRAK